MTGYRMKFRQSLSAPCKRRSMWHNGHAVTGAQHMSSFPAQPRNRSQKQSRKPGDFVEFPFEFGMFRFEVLETRPEMLMRIVQFLPGFAKAFDFRRILGMFRKKFGMCEIQDRT